MLNMWCIVKEFVSVHRASYGKKKKRKKEKHILELSLSHKTQRENTLNIVDKKMNQIAGWGGMDVRRRSLDYMPRLIWRTPGLESQKTTEDAVAKRNIRQSKVEGKYMKNRPHYQSGIVKLRRDRGRERERKW